MMLPWSILPTTHTQAHTDWIFMFPSRSVRLWKLFCSTPDSPPVRHYAPSAARVQPWTLREQKEKRLVDESNRVTIWPLSCISFLSTSPMLSRLEFEFESNCSSIQNSDPKQDMRDWFLNLKFPTTLHANGIHSVSIVSRVRGRVKHSQIVGKLQENQETLIQIVKAPIKRASACLTAVFFWSFVEKPRKTLVSSYQSFFCP